MPEIPDLLQGTGFIVIVPGHEKEGDPYRKNDKTERQGVSGKPSVQR